MAVREGAAAGVLAGEAHRRALVQQRAERQGLAERPVDLAVARTSCRRASNCLASLGCTVKPSGTCSSAAKTSSSVVAGARRCRRGAARRAPVALGLRTRAARAAPASGSRRARPGGGAGSRRARPRPPRWRCRPASPAPRCRACGPSGGRRCACTSAAGCSSGRRPRCDRGGGSRPCRSRRPCGTPGGRRRPGGRRARTASGSSPFTWKIGACTILATSVEYSDERAASGGVVKPSWLLMITWIVPPTR